MDTNQNRTRRIKSCSDDSIIVELCKKHEYTHNEINILIIKKPDDQECKDIMIKLIKYFI